MRCVMPERKTAVLNVRVRPEIKNALKDAAERETRSISNMVEVMVQEYCGQTKRHTRRAGIPDKGA